MNMDIDSIKKLKSIPKEYANDYKIIEYLYQNNSNIFENVNENLNLSLEFQQKILKLINDGSIVLTEKNIKLLDSFFSEDIIDILYKNFNYIYLINEKNFNQIGIARDSDFFELLEKNKFNITKDTPYLISLCSDYIIKQYVEDKVEIDIILPYFANWYESIQYDLIHEYLKKGNHDLSIFYTKNIHDNNIYPFFEGTTLEQNGNNYIVKSNNANLLSPLLNFELPFSISDIYLDDNKISDIILLNILENVNKRNINLNIKNGLKIISSLENCLKFLELCGNVGSLQLEFFSLDEFKVLLEKSQKHLGVVINVKLEDFMEYEEFFLNLNVENPVNIVSKEAVSILSLNEMKILNMQMDNMVAEIKNSSLSPYEKYIATYNIVKSLKKYSYYLDNKEFDRLIPDQSRNPYLVLINQYIVCAGYSSLLYCLLKKLAIPSHDWTLNVSEKSQCVILNPEEDAGAHARLYVNIVDEKYDINGYYMCDPTFDSVPKEKKDLYGYKYLSMSCGQSHDYSPNSSSYYYFSYDDDVFNDQMFINTSKYLEQINDLEELFMILKDLDPIFYAQLSKIENIEKQKEIIELHFKNKTYRPIPLNKKYDAIISVLEFQNKKTYSDIEKNDIRENLYNIDRDIVPDYDVIEFIEFDDDIEEWLELKQENIDVNKKR